MGNSDKIGLVEDFTKRVELITDGWKNVIFPNPQAEKLAKARAGICAGCGFNMLNICTKCSCPLPAKVRSVKDGSPIGKW